MGINVCIRKDGKDLPEWDSTRCADDNLFEHILVRDKFPAIKRVDNDYDTHYRPSDFAAWRNIIKESKFEADERYFQLVDILEKNPDTWIYICR